MVVVKTVIISGVLWQHQRHHLPGERLQRGEPVWADDALEEVARKVEFRTRESNSGTLQDTRRRRKNLRPEHTTASSGANPTILSYSDSVVKIYNATSSLVHFENKKYFLLGTSKKRSSLLQRWRCNSKFQSRRICSKFDVFFLFFYFKTSTLYPNRIQSQKPYAARGQFLMGLCWQNYFSCRHETRSINDFRASLYLHTYQNFTYLIIMQWLKHKSTNRIAPICEDLNSTR
jgi:hypothetical protein